MLYKGNWFEEMINNRNKSTVRGLKNKLPIYCLYDIHGAVSLVCITWYRGEKGYFEQDCPVLAICYDVGRCQIMKHENDTTPTLLETGIHITCAAWNENGSVLAVGGQQKFASGQQQTERGLGVVQFYNPLGDTCIQSIPSLIAIAGNDEHCCIASKIGSSAASFRIAIYNSLGSIMDSKTVKVEPKCLAMAGGYVIIADSSLIHLWQFKNPKTLFGMGAAIHVRNKQREGLERMAHIDQRESASNLSKMGLLDVDKPQTPDLGLLAAPSTKDPIAAIATSGSRHLFVARCSGEVVRYRLPDLWFDLAFQATEKRPNRIEVNADASIVGLIDEHGILTLHEVPDGQEENATSQKDQVLFDNFLRKDVWDLKFSEDDTKMFVAMEKTKMFIFHGVEAEPAIQTSAYIAGFRDLEVLGVLLDDLIQQADQPKLNSISNIPVKALNDCRLLLQNNTLEKAKAFVEENPHPRLWSLIAEAALNQLSLDTAEVAFVHCQNYQGIEFVKSLRNMQSENVRKAEVKAYFGDYQGAEKLFLSSDRCDLAVDLRRRLGDWFRVAQLAKESGVVVRDKELSEVWIAIGDHYFSKQDWAQAADLYKQGGEYKKLVRCLNLLEDYTDLENVVSELPDGHPLLPELADIFSSIGLGQQAIFALMKCARYKEAIDVCLELNEWQIALDLLPALSGDNDVSVSKRRLDNQLRASVLHLLEQGWTVQAVELLKRAGHYLDAAKLMLREAQSAAKAGCSLRKVKEIYVLVGLLVEKHHDRVRYEQENRLGDGRCQESTTILESLLNQTVDEEEEGEGDATEEDEEDAEKGVTQNGQKPLFMEEFGEDGGRGDLGSFKTVADSGSRRQKTRQNSGRKRKKATCPLAKRLLLSTYEVTRLVDQPWRGAEAYHFLMLCQNQLYSGHYEHALRTALLLRDLDDIIEPQKVYSIIALCALSARAFATASKAFLKLKNLPNWSPAEREELENLAVNIFSRYPPKNQVKSSSSMELDAMLESETKIPICAVTGQPVTDYQFWMCPTYGVAMGSPLGPLLADAFMGKLERFQPSDQIEELEHYGRYVDDIFAIATAETDVDALLNTVNQAHPSIRFTLEIETAGSLPFLDVLLSRRPDGSV
ncbi:WD repeat-containing protein 35 [Sparganum proliferum]